jgi:hypothetical protein
MYNNLCLYSKKVNNILIFVAQDSDPDPDPDPQHCMKKFYTTGDVPV